MNVSIKAIAFTLLISLLLSTIHASATSAASIAGTVYETNGTTPIHGFWGVKAFQAANYTYVDGSEISSDGTYEITEVPPGEYLIRAEPSTNHVFEYYNNVFERNEASVITVSEGQSITGINFFLEAGGSVSGHVKDQSGAPISGVHVYVESKKCEGTWLGGSDTDENGNFHIGGLPSGTVYVRICPDCNGKNYVNEWYNGADGTQDCSFAAAVTITKEETTLLNDSILEPGQQFSGQVNGTGVYGMWINVHDWGTMDYLGGAQVAQDGTYTVTGLPAPASGQYQVHLSSGDTWYVSEDYPEPVSPGDNHIDFTPQKGGKIVGTVTNTNQSGLEHICVNAEEFNCGAYIENETTDSQGYYSLTLPVGTYALLAEPGCNPEINFIREYWTASGGDFGCQNAEGITVELEKETQANFTLEPGATLSGTVADNQGNPIPNLHINADLFDTQGDWIYGTGNETSDDGTYTITGLAPGHYRLRADTGATDYISEYYNNVLNFDDASIITISGTETLTGYDFNLAPGGSISGYVFDSNGDVITDANISVHARPADSSWDGQGIYVSKSDGSFTISGLLPGEYKVEINNNEEPGYETRYYFDSLSWHNAEVVSVTEQQDTVLSQDVLLNDGPPTDVLNLWLQKRAWISTNSNTFSQSTQTTHVRKEFWIERWGGSAELLSPEITWRPGAAVENAYLEISGGNKGILPDNVTGLATEDPEYIWTDPGDFTTNDYWYGIVTSESTTSTVQVPADVTRSVDVDTFTSPGDQNVTLQVTAHDPDIRRLEARIYFDDKAIVSADEKGGDGSQSYWHQRIENPVAGKTYTFTKTLTITPQNNHGNPVKYIPRTRVRLFQPYSHLPDSNVTVTGKDVSVTDPDIGEFSIVPANNVAWEKAYKETSCKIEIEQRRIIQEINADYPDIIGRTPVDDTNSFPVDGSIVIQFSEPMDTQRTEQEFELVDENGNYIQDYYLEKSGGTFSWNAAEDTMTFTPSASLDYATGYEIEIGSRDKASEWMRFSFENHIWDFVTETESSDTSAPRVLSVWPADQAIGTATTAKNSIWFNSHISVQFSEAMDVDTLNSETVSLINTNTGEPVACSFGYKRKFFEILPSAPLLPYTTYEALLSESIADASGNTLASAFSWEFTTGSADTESPHVVDTLPENGSSNINIWYPRINVYFNEELDPSTVNTNTVTLKDDQDNIIDFYPRYLMKQYGLQIRRGVTRKFLPLENNRTYTITIGTEVTDMAGNSMSSPYVYSFTTKAETGNGSPSFERIRHCDVTRSPDGVQFSHTLWSDDDDWYWPDENLTVSVTDGVSTWPFQEERENWSYRYDTPTGDGETIDSGVQTLTFSVTDKDGETASKSRDVHIFSQTPEILSPLSGQTVISPVTVKWNSLSAAQMYKITVFNGTDPEIDPVLWTGVVIDDGSADYNLVLPEIPGLSVGASYYIRLQAYAGIDRVSPYGITQAGVQFIYSEPLDSDNDGLTDEIEDQWCTLPDDEDSDNDGLLDGEEDANHNGVNDPDETHPCYKDTDGDQMPDGWEVANNLDPLSDDSQGDADSDGFSNVREYAANTDPFDDTVFPSYEPKIENFETGDFSAYPWVRSGDAVWQVCDTNADSGSFSAQSPGLGNNQSAFLEIYQYCDPGEISFDYAVDSEITGDFLRFYIDGVLKDEWSGPLAYSRTNYPVSTGMHHFSWVYGKDAVGFEGKDAVWIDDISFPGSVDSDFDGMPDGWELEHQLDPVASDSTMDADKDLFTNRTEYLLGTDPQNPEECPPVESGFDEDLDLDGSDLKTFAEGLDKGTLSSSQLQDFAGSFGK